MHKLPDELEAFTPRTIDDVQRFFSVTFEFAITHSTFEVDMRLESNVKPT